MEKTINKRNEFQKVRLIVYGTIILVALYIQYYAQYPYLCDSSEYSCPMCGMRTAIDSAFNLDFKSAINSNPYFVLVLVAVIVMFVDTVHILYYYKKEKNNKAAGF